MVFDGRGVQGMGRTAIDTWGEGRSEDVWYESNTEGHSEGVFPVEYRRTDAVPTVATSEVLRFECLSRCYSSAYSRNVGGSTLRVPVEVLFQCLQSPRRRFYAPSACRGASPRCLQSQRRRFYASSACRGAIQRRLSSQRRRFYAPSWKCHIRRDFKDTATSRRPPPPLRQNQNEDQTSPQRQERTVSWFQVVGRAWVGFKRPSMMPGDFL